MTNQQKPEALRLADALESRTTSWPDKALAATKLRRLHARIAELESELEAVGAGGVQALSAAPEIHEPKCPALDGAGCTCAKHDPTIDRAWAQFCGGIGDGLDAPYPGMISAFERYYSQSFADKAWRNEASVWAAAWKAALLAASPTPPAEQQAAPKAAPGDVLDEALRERDDSEDFIDALLDEVLGHERPEWSSSYGRADALNDVQERMTALHKPAVDKAWGRFQSAMAALQQDEPVGEVVSASCDHATVRWLHQTSSVGGGDPRNSRAWPKVSGVSRDESHSRALLVFFAAEPTDDEARAVHDTLAAAPTAMAAPRQEAQEPVAWQGVHDQTDLYYTKPLQADVRPLYAAPQAAPVAHGDALDVEIAALESSCAHLGRLIDELRPDAERLEWVLRRVSGTWLRAYPGVVSDTSDMDTLRTLIDANRGALAAHGIKKENGNG